MTTNNRNLEENIQESKHLNGRIWLNMFALCFAVLSTAISGTLQEPFYPKEAEQRGATATEYSFVFSIYELTNILASPIIGRYLHILGTKTTLNVGMIVTGISVLCFGLLDYITSHFTFIFISFIFRIIEALGTSATIISSFSTVALLFPDSVGSKIATLQAAVGAAVFIGPTVGELLFAAGGYKLPFIALTGLIFLSNLFFWCVFPTISKVNVTEDRVSTWDLIKLPNIQMFSLTTAIAAMSYTFLLPVLEPHIRKFHLTPLVTGFMFVIRGASFSITSPIVGYVCDKWKQPRTVILLSTPIIIAGFIVVGPIPHLGIPNTLNFCILGLGLLGIATALAVPSSMKELISSAIKAGHPNDVSTIGVVSGLWYSAFTLGKFIGLSVSGYLYDLVGFEYESLFIIAVNFAMFCGLSIFIGIDKKYFPCQKQSSEQNP